MIAFHANLTKEWRLHRELLLDYLLAALVLAAVFPLANSTGFGIVACILAASLGTRIGGDEAMCDSWEFVLTRPISRQAWLRMRFSTGLLPLGLLLVLFLGLDLVGAHALFANLVTDPLEVTSGAGLLPLKYVAPAAAALFIYTLSFSFAMGEKRPEQVMNHRISGLLLGLIVLAILMATSQYLFRRLDGWNVHEGRELFAFAAFTVGACALVYLGTRRALVRREVIGGPSGAVAASSSAGWAVVLMIILLVLIALGVVSVLGYRSVAVNDAPAVYDVK